MEEEFCHILQQTEESYLAAHPGVTTKKEGWQVWYAQWLRMFFDLESIFGFIPTEAQLQYALLQGEIAYSMNDIEEKWSEYVGSRMYQLLAKSKS